MGRNFDVTTFISKELYLKKTLGAATFVDFIKIVPMFIKTIFKESKKVKRIRNYVSSCYLYLYFFM